MILCTVLFESVGQPKYTHTNRYSMLEETLVIPPKVWISISTQDGEESKYFALPTPAIQIYSLGSLFQERPPSLWLQIYLFTYVK